MMLLLIVLLCATAQAQLIVNTTEGQVEGRSEDGFVKFYGIPYAGSVDGANRFKAAPQPARRSEVFVADNKEIICAHPIRNFIYGVENCLTLNIFTKNLTTSSRPVLVWIDAVEYTAPYGGDPTFPRYVEEGVVVVNLKFRLSIFGFLCLGVEQAPGNAGIKDIIQGLEWINRNIAGFGGNPGNVTLMGHGSAAALVDIITMVPRANHLIHKAIALSGSALAPWAIAYNPVEYAEAVGQFLDYGRITRTELARKLTSTTHPMFARALNAFTFFNNTPLFAPCIENENISLSDAVLTDSPINILRAGNYNHIPYIAVYVTREGSIRSQSLLTDWTPELKNNFTKFLPADVDFSNNVAPNEAESVVYKYYFGSTSNSINVLRFQDYQGDTLIVTSVIRGARERATTSTAEVRLMEFGHMVRVQASDTTTTIRRETVGHHVIKSFLYGTDLQEEAEIVADSLKSKITAFANTGSPVSNAVQWPAMARNSPNYLMYGLHVYNGVSSTLQENGFNPQLELMRLWDPIYTVNYRQLTPVTSSAGHLGALLYVVLFSYVLTKLV